MLADEKGAWQGSGIGDIWDNQLPIKKGVKFPLKGTYKFDFFHGMRFDDLPGIMEVGLRIEKEEKHE